MRTRSRSTSQDGCARRRSSCRRIRRSRRRCRSSGQSQFLVRHRDASAHGAVRRPSLARHTVCTRPSPLTMSLAHKAARGALWTVISSMGGRAVGVIGTLVITRFLAPEVIGEVSDAAIITMTANWITIWGFGQYTVVKGRGEVRREVIWHATFFYLLLGVISLGAVAAFGGFFAPVFNAENAAKFIPGMALAVFIRRLRAMPERILTQQMNFRPSGLALALGEMAFTATALPLAAMGWGGWSMVIANIVKSRS